jgi:beta-glucosidase
MEVEIGGGRKYRVLLAPALVLSNRDLNQVRHHAVLAHGLAVQAIRTGGVGGTKVGFADNAEVAIPIVDTSEHVKAAEVATREANAPFLTVMLEGRYTDSYLQQAGNEAPEFTDEEMETIGSPLDFVGINEYRPARYVEPSDDPSGYHEVPINASHLKMKSGCTSSTQRSCTGRRARSSQSGARPRSTSPRTAAPRMTWLPTTAGSTTPTG